tara:strand:+ start:2321 stop:2524 length:204 start_codon:yes stop_codon:yes gene_type:complete
MNTIEYQLYYSELSKKGIKIQEGSTIPIDPDPDYCKDCNAPDPLRNATADISTATSIAKLIADKPSE